MSENYYSILEVPQTATIDEIKKSYRRLSLLCHPDRNQNSSESTFKFQRLNEAYEVLSDTEKKKEYDMINNNPFLKMMGQMNINGQHANMNMNMGINPMEDILNNLFNSFGQGGQPFGQGIHVFHNGINVNGTNVNGINTNGQQFYRSIQKPTPIMKTIDVPIDKILSGTTMPVDIERWLIQEGNKVFEKETIYVDVPKGIDEGEIIILRDKGNVAANDVKGDIKIYIRIQNTSEFKRQGLDLILEKNISLKEALCGFTFEIKYLTGKVYTINNNSGNIIVPGYKKMIPNMGFSRDQHTGNLIIIFNVKFPEKLDDKILEQLRQIEF
jgi:DnaJ family protein B protein 4